MEEVETPASAAIVFDSYWDAHWEASRCSAANAAKGLATRVVRSPYGGFAIRTLPAELLSEPLLRLAGRRDEVSYADLR